MTKKTRQPLRTKQGDLLTDEVIEALADEAERGYSREDWTGRIVANPATGRPPLSDDGESRQLRVRVEPQLDHDLRAAAKAEGCSLSELTRAALREYLQRHAA